MDETQCRRALAEAFPDLAVASVAFEGEGWDYEIWSVNGHTLFRFPRRRDVAEQLENEVSLLRELTEALPVPVPNPRYYSEGCRSFKLPFMGYERVEGTPLSHAVLGSEERERAAREAGRFIGELHSFPRERAEEVGVRGYTPESWRQHYVDFHRRMHEYVYVLLPAEIQAAAETFWTQFLSDERMQRFEPVLIHGDLGPEHVLVDEGSGAVTGVIDFGDAAVADPALDLAGFEEPFRRLVLEQYGAAGDPDILVRAEYYRRIVPFHKVMFGAETGDRDMLRRGIEGIRHRLEIRVDKKHK